MFAEQLRTETLPEREINNQEAELSADKPPAWVTDQVGSAKFHAELEDLAEAGLGYPEMDVRAEEDNREKVEIELFRPKGETLRGKSFAETEKEVAAQKLEQFFLNLLEYIGQRYEHNEDVINGLDELNNFVWQEQEGGEGKIVFKLPNFPPKEYLNRGGHERSWQEYNQEMFHVLEQVYENAELFEQKLGVRFDGFRQKVAELLADNSAKSKDRHLLTQGVRKTLLRKVERGNNA